MTKKEMIKAAIESLGYKPEEDDDGDIKVCYQMKRIFFMTGDDDEQYVSAILPQLSDVDEGEEALTLAICNKVSRDVKMVKVYVNSAMRSVSASCEFYYTDMDSLEMNVECSLRILGMVRSAYIKARSELSDD